MRYGDNKPKYIRWAIYVVLIVVAVLLQNSKGGLLEIFGARVFLTIPLCVVIAMFEREVPAALFGALAGILWDVSSGVDGFNAVVLIVLGSVCSLFISHLMRNNIITSLVLGAGSVAAYEIIYLALRFWNADNPIKLVFNFYLPSFVITVLVIPICYWIVKNVYDSYRIAE